jgi:hypothetical protein
MPPQRTTLYYLGFVEFYYKVSPTKGRTQIKDVREQGAEENIWP